MSGGVSSLNNMLRRSQGQPGRVGRAGVGRRITEKENVMSPDFWDKLFKTNLGIDDPSFAISAVTSTITLYAQGVITKQQIAATLKDSAGNLLTTEEQVQMMVITDAIDAEPSAAAKVVRALRINAAAQLAELGQINKATAKTLAGV